MYSIFTFFHALVNICNYKISHLFPNMVNFWKLKTDKELERTLTKFSKCFNFKCLNFLYFHFQEAIKDTLKDNKNLISNLIYIKSLSYEKKITANIILLRLFLRLLLI